MAELRQLTEFERAAYRSLLYDATLDTRNLCQPRARISYNPIVWQRLYLQGRLAGALADWLHNLAQFAARDSFSFDTDWFWREYDYLVQEFSEHLGPGKWMDYRYRYEQHLARYNTA